MEKKVNKKLCIAMAIIFFVLYVAGLVFADIKIVDYAYISTDSEEVSFFPSLMSTLTFIADAFMIRFAVKSKQKSLLLVTGIANLITPFVSLYALLPFAYQLLSIFTDFPAVIIQHEKFFAFNEIFWKIDDLIPFESTFILYALTILCAIIGLISIIIGIINIVYSAELGKDNEKLEKRVKRFSVFLVVIGVLALAATGAQVAYDMTLTSRENNYFNSHLESNTKKAWDFFDKLEVPMSEKNVKALGKKYNLSDDEMQDMKYHMLVVYSNDAYSVQLCDDDEDGIYELKRIFGYDDKNLENVKSVVESLEKGCSYNDFRKLLGNSNIGDYRESYIGEKIVVEINLYSHETKEEYSKLITFENGKITGFDDYSDIQEAM